MKLSPSPALRRTGLRPVRPAARLMLAGLALCAAGAASAQFKVVGPDGRITYTDRPPAAGSGQASTMPRKGNAAAAAPEVDPALPYALRQTASRYPVTLYAASGCGPCDAARRYLQERGIPFSERTLSTAEDGEAMVARFGSTDVPTLTIGQKPLQGYAPEQWAAMLDAAGYPRNSQLPRQYKAPTAQPLADRPAPAASEPEPAPGGLPEAPPPQLPASSANNPGGLRF